jgi:hypothetical protein
MTTLEELEKAVTELPADQLAEFRAWFEEFEAARFDERIERDAKAGRLDRLADQAVADFRHLASPSFWQAYATLPASVRELADKNYALLKKNPRHPSLQLKKVGRFWSVRVGSRYRALAVEVDQDLLWFWIGSHADYDAIV